MGSDVSKEANGGIEQPSRQTAMSPTEAPGESDAPRHEKQQPRTKVVEQHQRRQRTSRSPQHTRGDHYFQEKGPDRPRRRDHYSPRRSSISPPPFRRGPSSGQHTREPDYYRHSSPTSPGRGQHRESPSSPQHFRSSPAERRPSKFQQDVGNPSHGHSADQERTTFRNAVWHAPDYHLKLKTGPPEALARKVSAPAVTDKINFNGLSDVPTGPRGGLARKIAAMQRPHIFIPASCLPTLPTTTKHLAKFLHVVEAEIYIDAERGWIVCFEDSQEGRDRLVKCYSDFNLKLLFSQHMLNMQCFPNGTKDEPAVPGSARQPDGESEVVDEGIGQPLRTILAAGKGHGIMDDIPAVQESSASAQSPAVQPTNGVAPARLSPSLLRADRDDSSSVSVLTGSDGTKSSKCHVCKAVSLSALEPLARCSTCPRQYHRRCQPKHTFPTDKSDLSDWQCQRCVKKQVPLKRRTPIELSEDDGPAPANLSVALDCSVMSQGQVIQHPADAVPSPPRDAPFTEGVPTTERPPRHSDADDLVEQMFAANTPPAQQTKKTGRLSLVRKKLTPKQVSPEIASENLYVQQSSVSAAAEQFSGAKRKLNDLNDLPSKNKTPDLSSEKPEAPVHGKAKRSRVEPDTFSASAGDRDTLKAPHADPSIAGGSQTMSGSRHVSKESQAEAEVDSTEPKTKSHKWSGGGADKSIIEDGFRTLFDNRSRQPPANSEQAAASKPATPVSIDKEERLSTSATEARLEEPGRAEDGDGAKNVGSGLRLRKPNTSTCATCGRRIALNPGGTNIHCVTCKKKNNELSATPTVTSNANSSAIVNAELRNTLDDAPSVLDEAVNTPKGDQLGVAGPDDLDAQTQPDATKSDDQRTACASCRLQHRRCTHGANGPLQPQESIEEDADDADSEPAQQAQKQQRTLKRPQGYPEDDETSELSDLSTQDDTPAVPEDDRPSRKVIKRRSFKSVAKNDYDLGNGFERPKNTYPKLVAMAVSSAQNNRMHSKEIVPWIAANVPGYNVDEGNWVSGIDATISQYRWKPPEEHQICKRPYWRTHNSELGNGKGRIVEMLPDAKDIMPQWDAVLKMPISPLKGDGTRPDSRSSKATASKKRRRGSKQQVEAQDGAREGVVTAAETTKTSDSASRREVAFHEDVEIEDAWKLGEQDQDIDELMHKPEAPQESSDDEPLSRQKRARLQASSDGVDKPLAAARLRLLAAQDNLLTPSNPEAEVDPSAVQEEASMKSPAKTPTPNREHPHSVGDAVGLEDVHETSKTNLQNRNTPHPVARLSLAARIKRESENVAYDAPSLFAEWPEYDTSSGPFDKAAKIAEIQARPRRKQRPRMRLSQDPWADPPPSSKANECRSGDKARRSPSSFDRSTRTSNKMLRTTDPLQYDTADANTTECESWDEFFDIPANPMPILHDGQLAYRDGTRNEDGTLPRAKVVFKTGFA